MKWYPALTQVILFAALPLLLIFPQLSNSKQLSLPYKKAGLSKAQAAAHLLDRFGYGPRQGDVERVVEMGLENWLSDQLRGDENEPKLQQRLKALPSLTMSTEQLYENYPPTWVLMERAGKEGSLDDNGVELRDKREQRRQFLRQMKDSGVDSQRDMLVELQSQKLLRAVYSKYQLKEVLADFWFNHFNVSMTNRRVRPYILQYERDVIRPNVLGDFHSLLAATAKHPAMLIYLDNAKSTADRGRKTYLETLAEGLPSKRAEKVKTGLEKAVQKKEQAGLRRGINENYARELLELHTLGVDGGYTQKDVVEVSRALTGWTVFPMGEWGEKLRERVQKRSRGLGYVYEGDFLFRSDSHDSEAKTILGHRFPPGRGIEEGKRVLRLLSQHPSTAEHISFKLARRFVSDDPPRSLVKKLRATYLRTGGDIKEMILVIAESEEFWAPDSRRQKIKSPFELVASSIRALNAEIEDTERLLKLTTRMGQVLYGYRAPTGYPDTGETWINSGSLLNRMNFAMALAAGRIKGVNFDLLSLNQGKEPESYEAALETYANLLMPERDHTETLRLLTPLIRDTKIATKVRDSASRHRVLRGEEEIFDSGKKGDMRKFDDRKNKFRSFRKVRSAGLGHVVGLLLGSPEFQRH